MWLADLQYGRGSHPSGRDLFEVFDDVLWVARQFVGSAPSNSGSGVLLVFPLRKHSHG